MVPESPSEPRARAFPGRRLAWLWPGKGHLEQLAGRRRSLPLGVDLLAAIAFYLHALGPLYVEGDFLGKRRENQDPGPWRPQSCHRSHGVAGGLMAAEPSAGCTPRPRLTPVRLNLPILQPFIPPQVVLLLQSAMF